MTGAVKTAGESRLEPRLFLPAEDVRAKRQWRDDPSEDIVARIRQAFPSEREYDVMFSRKMQRRNLGPYRIPSLGEMSGYVRHFLNDHIDGGFEISDEGWLTGGASKLQFGFTLTWTEGGRKQTEKLVVRMEPAESLNTTSRGREFQMIQAMNGVVPVPKTYWMDPQGKWFPEPAIVYGFITGTTKPSQDKARVSGTGTVFSPELRAKLGPQFTGHLAAIHSHDYTKSNFDMFDVPEIGTTQSALWQLNRVLRVWEEDRGEDIPLVEAATNWLRDNLPVLDRVSPIHGDYRSGNFLFDEAKGEMTGWLDWERGYLGDRHRDLAWATTRLFGNTAEDGKTFLVCGLVPEEQFYEDYEKLSGLSIDPKRMHYYRVFNAYQLVCSCLGTSYRVVRLGKSHQDVLLSIVEGAAYPIANELLQVLGEAN
ncbi:MAG: phosphotransferase family protein [Rhodobiaceae bacterium]|nr:phosphotransferase family protein [Rhodobiaceae bacterium]MCC0055335.1 phosphotransferase family protein [Rhodobiaceae bacterium]